MSQGRVGLVYGIAAYAAWGVVPVFWKQLTHVAALELVAHRVVWSLAFVLVLLALQRRVREVVATVRDRRRLAWMAGATALISTNWLLYVWAVLEGRITQASLGYYINPLVNVLLGRLFLGERLSRAQTIGIVVAGVGVLNLAVAGGEVPWVALTLAVTFGFYGLLRKQAPVLPLPGLAVETLVATPAALALIGWQATKGEWAFAHSTPWQSVLVVAAGAVTALPLLWFAHAAQRLKFATLGILQYIAPTLQLAIAVLLYGEPFTSAHVVTFACIWAAVALYATDAVLATRRMARPVSG